MSDGSSKESVTDARTNDLEPQYSPAIGQNDERRAIHANHTPPDRSGASVRFKTERLIHAIRETYSSNLDGQEKRNRCGALVRELVVIAGTQNTVAVIDEVVGSGMDKSVLVGQAFEWAVEPLDESMVSLQQLAGIDYKQGYTGLFSRLLKSGSMDSVEALLSSEQLPRSWDCVQASLSVVLANIQSDSEAVELFRKAAGMIPGLPDEEQKGYLTALVNSGTRRCVFAVWENLEELSSKGNLSASIRSVIAGARNQVVAAMAFDNPERASECLRLAGDGQSGSLATAMKTWLKSSETACMKWYSENSEKMSAKQRSNALSAFAQYKAVNGDFVAARDWTSRIEDMSVRKSVDGQVWTAERDALRKAVAKDPAAMLESITTGQSYYGDYWLEEAMGTWVAKDFDKAQEWYQQNWSSLPAGKSQYLAAAFANQAVNQGDTATARQWAAYIQDPKTKQRIEAGIAKAEGAKGN